MAHHDDVVFRIEFLIRPRRHFAHRDVLRSGQAGFLNLPWLANVQQDKRFALLLQALHLPDADLEIQEWAPLLNTRNLPARRKHVLSRRAHQPGKRPTGLHTLAGRSHRAPSDSAMLRCRLWSWFARDTG